MRTSNTHHRPASPTEFIDEFGAAHHAHHTHDVRFRNVIAASPTEPLIDMRGLLRAAEYQLLSWLEEFAQKSVTQLSLEDLILPAHIHSRVVEVIAACRNLEQVQVRWGFAKRLPTGRWLNVLFDRPPGTGKSLCAEILTRELGRPLFRAHA